MATYRVGDRVRVVATYPNTAYPGVLGAEGVVVCAEPNWAGCLQVEIAGDSDWFFLPEHLAPLTPPKQQETITWDEACFDRHGHYREPVTVRAA